MTDKARETISSPNSAIRHREQSIPDEFPELDDTLVTTAPPSGLAAPPKRPPVLADLHGPNESLLLGRTTTETHALTTARSCPDRYWIAAKPSTQSILLERLIDSLLRQNERILLLTSTSEAANYWTSRFLNESIRALAPDESVPELPGDLQSATSEAHGTGRVLSLRERLIEKIQLANLQLELASRSDIIWEQMRICLTRPEAQTEIPNPPSGGSSVALHEELTRLRSELRELLPLVTAKSTGNVFSRAYWRATFHSDLLQRARELESRIKRLECEPDRTDETPFPLKSVSDLPIEDFDRLCNELNGLGIVPPNAATPEDLENARRIAEGNRQETEASLHFAEKTLADLESDPVEMAVQYLSRTSLVIGPFRAMSDLAMERGTFDRCLVEGAESVTDTAWELVSSRSDRMIFLGDFESNEQNTGPLRKVQVDWLNQHQPQWHQESDRLVAVLEPFATVSHTEPLADRPEVELRFGFSVSGEYRLIAVAFAPGCSVSEAKSFLANDLDEVQLIPLGPSRWNADDLTVAWPLLEADDGVWIDVGPGVQERVVTVDGLPATAAVRFDSDRFTKQSAEGWVKDHSARAESARSAVLSESSPEKSS